MTVSYYFETNGEREKMFKYSIGISATLLTAAYIERQLRQNTDRVVYCEPKQTDPRRKLATHIERILKSDPSLREPNYNPPFWIFNSWINVFVFILKQKWTKYRDRDQLIRTDVRAEDGSRLYVDWLRGDEGHLPSDAPLLLILPTISGDGPSHTYIMKEASRRGYRSCVLNRRGLSSKLETPRFNVMGDQHDTVLQVAHIKKRFQDSCFVGLIGLSGGSGLLVNYLGSVRYACVCVSFFPQTLPQNNNKTDKNSRN